MEKFLDLMDDVTNGPGTHAEKRDRVVDAADEHGLRMALEEFLSWFGGEIPAP